MRWTMRNKIAIFLAVIMLVSTLSACASKENVAAKQIERYIQEQEEQVRSFTNIDIDKLDSQNAMGIIQELTSEKYKGRKTGTLENEMAVQYIADYFKSIGVKNPSGLEAYLQYYKQSITKLKATPKLSIVKKDGSKVKDFEYPKNFAFRVLSDSTSDIKIEAPLLAMSGVRDIYDSELEENHVLLFSLKAQGRLSLMEIMHNAYESKASAIILEVDVNSENRHFSDLIVTTLSKRNWGESYKPVITVDSSTFAELFEAAAQHRNISVECSYSIEEGYAAANVIGFIPGSDENLKNEYIIIGGHLDHVGDNFNGTYNAGALDNASGTAAIMEIARVITQNPVKPKKTVVFIAFNGEEYGLLGSAYYASNPIFPLRKAVMINLDMVGSALKLPLTLASGEGHINQLKSEFLEIATVLGIEAKADTLSNSDHFYFGEKKVPVVYLAHMDDKNGFHSPNDTLEDIDGSRLEEVMKLVLFYLDKKAF